jgi:hypothetical protein
LQLSTGTRVPTHDIRGSERMASRDAKEKLVRFLEQRAFEPVLHADPESYNGRERDRLHDAQRRTRTEIDRFRNYGSAQDVVTNFKRDLHSHAAEKVHRELKELRLPAIGDVREDFERLAADLGVS